MRGSLWTFGVIMQIGALHCDPDYHSGKLDVNSTLLPTCWSLPTYPRRFRRPARKRIAIKITATTGARASNRRPISSLSV